MDEIREIPIPADLKEIPQPPKKLYCIGSLPPEGTLLLTVVGTRRFTGYGKEVCEELIAGLSGYPISIVSGLALGIDTIAHRAALKAKLHTIAVPGSGLATSSLYPRTNISLARDIVSSGGALLSEFEPDFRATLWSFPQRNRIMAGIAKATLVIEASERSGTLITSRLATDYNRDVFAVPGNIFSEQSKGPNMLIRLGATPITASRDILLALGFTPAPIEDLIDFSVLEPQQRRVMEMLIEPLQKEEVIQRLRIEVSKANVLLMKMEISGLIKEEAGHIRRA